MAKCGHSIVRFEISSCLCVFCVLSFESCRLFSEFWFFSCVPLLFVCFVLLIEFIDVCFAQIGLRCVARLHWTWPTSPSWTIVNWPYPSGRAIWKKSPCICPGVVCRATRSSPPRAIPRSAGTRWRANGTSTFCAFVCGSMGRASRRTATWWCVSWSANPNVRCRSPFKLFFHSTTNSHHKSKISSIFWKFLRDQS